MISGTTYGGSLTEWGERSGCSATEVKDVPVASQRRATTHNALDGFIRGNFDQRKNLALFSSAVNYSIIYALSEIAIINPNIAADFNICMIIVKVRQYRQGF